MIRKHPKTLKSTRKSPKSVFNLMIYGQDNFSHQINTRLAQYCSLNSTTALIFT